MRKLTLIILFYFCLFTFHLYSQWTQLPNLPVSGTVADMYFVNANTGWVSLTSPNSLIKTTNGGANWFVQVPNDNSFAVIQFFNDTLGLAKSYFDSGSFRISKTTNGGTNWNTIYTTGNSLADMFFVNKDTGWICGYDGSNSIVWITTNGGIGFQSQYSYSGNGANRLFFMKQKINGEYCGWMLDGIILSRTLNTGVNWIQIPNNLGSPCTGTFDIYFTDTSRGLVTGNPSCFSITTNGGYNWTIIFEFGSVNSAIGVGDSNKAWLTMGTQDTVMKTTNFFQTYGKQVTAAFASAIFALDTSIVYAGRNQTNMMKTTNGGGPLVGIEQISSTVPDKFSLSQNYPNPFNPQTTIEFSLGKSAFITITIYDILGREISTALNNEFMTAGTYKALLDFGKLNVSSGIYFIRLEATDGGLKNYFTDTKKMAFIK